MNDKERNLLINFIASCIILFVGAIICPFLTVKEFKVYRLLTGAESKETTGVIVAKQLFKSQISNHYIFYIEFEDEKLRKRTIQTMFNVFYDKRYTEGQIVPIVYNVNKSGVARINSFIEVEGPFWGLLFLNSILLFTGIYNVTRSYNKIRKDT